MADENATDGKKTRKSRKVSVEELVKTMELRDAYQAKAAEMQRLFAETDTQVKSLIKRAAAGTVKKALEQMMTNGL